MSPRPRNDSVDSERIAIATISTVLAKISGSTLGRTCFRMIQNVEAPRPLERSRNIRSLTDSTWLRMIREVPAQPVTPITMITIEICPKRLALGPLAEQRHQHDRQGQEGDDQEPVVDRGQRCGRSSRRRSRRLMPMMPPMTAETRAAEMPTIIDTRVPQDQQRAARRGRSPRCPAQWARGGRRQDVRRVGRRPPSGPAARSRARRWRSV